MTVIVNSGLALLAGVLSTLSPLRAATAADRARDGSGPAPVRAGGFWPVGWRCRS